MGNYKIYREKKVVEFAYIEADDVKEAKMLALLEGVWNFDGVTVSYSSTKQKENHAVTRWGQAGPDCMAAAA